MEGLAGDVGTGIGGQKDHRPGKVLRYLDPAERNVFLELEKERTVVGMHRGVHGAGLGKCREWVLSWNAG